ncbi:type II RES/Xre toxin-antitoxin system antitoxin [Paraburkholderia bonniea]|uniref:type II RES/Xre toxin-antitoxin system antitoxin n=1 Tax=Paraburkholderia bonniea TaxID=2152891 RepID=UPI0012913573|nr:antitoxin Xre/MbcA/ParS toxin-binding domain-containing protein [Paraburkholderia bonniea]
MSLHTIQKEQGPRGARSRATVVKLAVAARLAQIGTHGLGLEQDDFRFFLDLDPIEQSQLIRDGMEAMIINRIASELLGIPMQSLLASLRLPGSTINRKIAQRERLSASEADRAARAMLIYGQAADVLEDPKLAAEWLMRPNAQLRDERPLNLLDTQTGFDRVRDILLRLEHGVTV